jgi:hypothetical protein
VRLVGKIKTGAKGTKGDANSGEKNNSKGRVHLRNLIYNFEEHHYHLDNPSKPQPNYLWCIVGLMPICLIYV